MDQNLVNGTGEGTYFFVEQQRRVKTHEGAAIGPFTVPWGDRYVNPFVRTYTFDQTESSKWKVWDSDPHKFGGNKDSPDTDWYQSNKRLNARVFDNEINDDKLVKYYFDSLSNDADNNGYLDENEVGNPKKEGREYEIKYDTEAPGAYQLTASYRGGQHIRHKIIIKSAEPESPLGSILAYDLSSYDKNLLKYAGMPLDDNKQYKVLEIRNVKSKFMYHLGQRNNYEDGLNDFQANVTPSTKKLKKVNRWGPYLDYEGRYYWYSHNSGAPPSELDKVSHETIDFKDWSWDWNFSVQEDLSGQGFADYDFDGERAQKFPSLWGNHFSSLWKAEGPGGSAGPEYMPTSGLKHDVNEFASHIGAAFNALFETDPNYWQYRATLNSWADSYGYRMRYNPSHIYDLSKVFDDTYGAFTGNAVSVQYTSGPNTGNTKMIQPYPSDNFLNLQAWYYDLKMGRKVIVESSVYGEDGNPAKFSIYSDFDKEEEKYANIGTYTSENGLSIKEVYVGDSQRTVISMCDPCLLDEKDAVGNITAKSAVQELVATSPIEDSVPEIGKQQATPELHVYPVPSEGTISITVTVTQFSPLHMALYDIGGRVMYEYHGHVDPGTNTFTFDKSLVGLSKGLYLLKMTTQELTETKKVVFK